MAACEREPVLIRTSTFDGGSRTCSPNGFQIGGTLRAPVCACLPGFSGDGFNCSEIFEVVDAPCVDDRDVGTATFTVTHLGIASRDGFNIDGLSNAPVPGGSGPNVAGCGKGDLLGGIDNGMASVATSLTGVLDLEGALQASLANGDPDGGIAGSSPLLVVLSHLPPDNAANDACVQADLVVSTPGQPLRVVHGRGTLTNNVAFVIFQNGISWSLVPELSPSMCVDGVCNPATLELPIHSMRGRFILNAAHTDLIDSSVLGGFSFVEDCTGASQPDACADGDFASANAEGFAASLETWASAANVVPTLQTMVEQAFMGARDLHLNADGTTSPCTGPNVATTNTNSLSLAISLDSL